MLPAGLLDKGTVSRVHGLSVAYADQRGFTLIELIAVVVILAVLAGVALPVYFDHDAESRESAAAASIGGIRSALNVAFISHRMNDAPSSEWITTIDDIVTVMDTGALPAGVKIVDGELEVQEGGRFTFTAETVNEPARLTGGSGGGGGGTSPSIIAMLLSAYLARKQRSHSQQS